MSNNGKQPNNGKQRVTLFLNPKLLKRAKVQAVVEEVTLTILAEKALIKYLPRELVIGEHEIIKRKVVK